MITQSINLNLVPGGVLPRINVSQYDKGTRTLEFTLYNGSVLFSIPDDVTITIQGTKADSTGFQYECTFEDSVVTSDLSEQMTVFAGEVVCELVLTQETNILGTANFILNVEAAALSDDTVISDTDLPLLQEAVEAAAEAAASAEEAANNASAAEESSEDSEAYAIGTRGGTDVTSDDPAYHNNAKYYAESVAEAIENLDVSDTAVAGAYVTAVSETDGEISVTREAADTTPTSGSKKMVTSGGVYTELDELSSEISNKMDWESNDVLGAKNFIPYPYYNDSTTINGVTFTINDDGSVTLNGTATASTTLYLRHHDEASPFKLKAGKQYIFTGAKDSDEAIGSTYVDLFLAKVNGESTWINSLQTPSQRTFTITTETALDVGIYIGNGQTVSNFTFYPMIRLTTYTDPTYVPYAKTNKELTEDVDTNASNIASVKSGVFKLNSYNNEQQLSPNTSYTIPNMNGIYLVFLTRAGLSTNCGVYLTQCHTNGSNVVLPLAAVTATGFSMSFSGTSLVIATGNTEPRVRFMKLTTANY